MRARCYATGITPAMAFAKPGTGSAYAYAARDSMGRYLDGARPTKSLCQSLDGSRNYRLKVPPNAPVTQFWSATIQEDKNGVFMDVAGRVSLASTGEGVVKNPDGSLDVYFGPTAPEGHESNWVQTAADKHWFILFRFYGPQRPVFDKSWRLGDIEALN